jgi:hypothetical protein
MKDIELFDLINKLPPIAKYQVQHLVIHLAKKEKAAGAENFKDMGFSMADDFDRPLKEFHDYMYNIDIEFIDKIEKLPFVKQNELEALVDEMLKE